MIIFTFLLTYTLVIHIYLYRYCLRPFLAVSCCMYPHCSEYGLEAVKKHGVWKGGYLALKRISSCHPYQKHPVDLVP